MSALTAEINRAAQTLVDAGDADSAAAILRDYQPAADHLEEIAHHVRALGEMEMTSCDILELMHLRNLEREARSWAIMSHAAPPGISMILHSLDERRAHLASRVPW